MKLIVVISCILLHIVSAQFISPGNVYLPELVVKAQGVCPELDDPEFGEVSYCDTEVGDTACYCCCDDYELDGDEERTCQSDGTWSGDEPVCRYTLACAELSDPVNGNVEVSAGTDIGSVATYTCNDGYILSGSSTRTCEEGGLWSGDAPTCEAVQCADPSAPDNGAVSTTGTGVGDTATYTCDDGYELSGSATSTCQSNGEWSGSPPTCEAVQCAAPSAPDNGEVSTTGTGVGDTATYTCDDGYELSGSDTQTCQSNGEWSGSPPTCEENVIDCGPPPDVINATYTLSDGTVEGSVATYSCKSGFKLVKKKENSLTCEANGEWSGTMPRCKDINECNQELDECEQRCVNTVGSYYCECKRKYFLLPDGVTCSRIDLELSDDSPRVPGDGTVEVTIENNDDRVTRIECAFACNLNTKGCVEFPVQDCTDGTFSQDGLVTGLRYNLRITAYLELSDGTEVQYREPKIFFVAGSTDEPYYCAVNRIGEPEYIGANDISLAFAPSGPFDSYKCSIDDGATFEPCTSRWQSSNSSPGPGEVIICPISQTCYDAKPNSSACRCLNFVYDTTVGERAEKYRAEFQKCFES